jgi:hypothetical protein
MTESSLWERAPAKGKKSQLIRLQAQQVPGEMEKGPLQSSEGIITHSPDKQETPMPASCQLGEVLQP